MREAAERDWDFDGLVGEMATQRTNGDCAKRLMIRLFLHKWVIRMRWGKGQY
jgi:hypothetical protein